VDTNILIPLIAAVVGPAIAYIVAVRRMSGRIDTSAATDLWKESQAIREDYRTQLAAAAGRTRDLEARVRSLEQMNDDLARDNRSLRIRISELELQLNRGVL
jgi:chromosome segregation ATPase